MLQHARYKNYASWLLAAFFLIGAVANFNASEQVRSDYANWGYPDWFHYVTAALEFLTAVLLARGKTRLAGSALGAAVMLAAAMTLFMHGGYSHALVPLVVLTLVAINGWFALDSYNRKTQSTANPSEPAVDSVK